MKKLLETARAFIASGELFDADLCLEAALAEATQLETKAERRERQLEIIDHCQCTLLWSLDKVRDHFNEDGTIKGDGKWRLTSIAECIREMNEAASVAARRLNELDEAAATADTGGIE